MIEYKEDKNLIPLFVGQPYVTVHMSAKERNEYQMFKSGRKDLKKGQMMQQPLLPPPMAPMPPMGYPMMYPNQPPMQFRPPVNYGLPSMP